MPVLESQLWVTDITLVAKAKRLKKDGQRAYRKEKQAKTRNLDNAHQGKRLWKGVWKKPMLEQPGRQKRQERAVDAERPNGL